MKAIFYEFVCGSHEAFEELNRELQRVDAHHVVVPSLRHLAKHRILQNSMLFRLEYEANAEVLELSDC